MFLHPTAGMIVERYGEHGARSRRTIHAPLCVCFCFWCCFGSWLFLLASNQWGHRRGSLQSDCSTGEGGEGGGGEGEWERASVYAYLGSRLSSAQSYSRNCRRLSSPRSSPPHPRAVFNSERGDPLPPLRFFAFPRGPRRSVGRIARAARFRWYLPRVLPFRKREPHSRNTERGFIYCGWDLDYLWLN